MKPKRRILSMTLALLAGLFLAACEDPPVPSQNLGSQWRSDIPSTLKGKWVVGGRCHSETTMMLIFDKGGYRWRKPDGSWGFARGHFSFASDVSHRVLFKVRRLQPTPGYESILTVSGNTLRKFNVKSGTQETLQRCDD